MFTRPGILLRLEGAGVFAVSLFVYHSLGGGLGIFLLLFLWPDLFMLGYLANVLWGARLYNLAHTDAFPVLFGISAYVMHQPVALLLAFIWLAHIGFDRMLGYGLKYPTFFKDTHLQRL
jgi:hypothetical protein